MKAMILLSGGLDSTVILAWAMEHGRECHAITFDYGQRHRQEIESAKGIAKQYAIQHRIVRIDSQCFGTSSLVTSSPVPKNRSLKQIADCGVPATYVPARNTIFLSYAMGMAEIIGADEIYVGFNALDHNPYPDCTPEFVTAFQGVVNVATKQAVEGKAPKIIAPFIKWSKNDIFREGIRLGAPVEKTWSCYDPTPNSEPCGTCDACILRNSIQ